MKWFSRLQSSRGFSFEIVSGHIVGIHRLSFNDQPAQDDAFFSLDIAKYLSHGGGWNWETFIFTVVAIMHNSQS